MNLQNGQRLVRIPAFDKLKEGSAVLDKNDKILKYSRNIVSSRDTKVIWDWVRADQKGN